MAFENIEVRKAKMHNLKSIDVVIPRNSLTVITGPSGSGKSSLAFDTIYAEGQRRYIESLSSYARQFLGQIDPPDVESITGLSPAIAIEQKSTSKNPRSTVGTVTEIYDYLRVLFARVGTPHCPESGEELIGQTAQQMVDGLKKLSEGTKLTLLAPVIKEQKGEHKELLSKFMSMGFTRVRHNGEMVTLDDSLVLAKTKRHSLEVVVDRIVVKPGIESRINDSVELALRLGEGSMLADINGDLKFMSEKLFSHKSQKGYPELTPRLFSFNSPLGACESCNGLGVRKVFDLNKMIQDETLSIEEGAIGPLYKKNSFLLQMVKSVMAQEKIKWETPFNKIPDRVREIILNGGDKVYTFTFTSENSNWNFKKEFVGILSYFNKKFEESDSEKVREDLEEFMNVEVCPDCKGQRLKPYPLATTIDGLNIMQFCHLPIDESYARIKKIKLVGDKKIIAEKLLKEITERLRFLVDVGLTYLSLSRDAMSLSGGESQRIRLATQIGSALSGVVYVLDEPSIGLHQRDNDKLIQTLKNLKELGNTVIVVEHDEDTMRAADYLIDMGPGAGVHGGEVVSAGRPSEVAKNTKSITGKYLSGKEAIIVPEKRRNLTKKITLTGANENNLKNLNLELPLEGLICLTGVSGSGKSTLVHQVLVPAIKEKMRTSFKAKKNFKKITGADQVESLIELDQTPIGRTPKSNPATYTKLFDEIRDIFCQTNEAKIRGYKAGRFSFNVKGGRCEACEGNGTIKVEMNFLPDVFIVCGDCNGKRYNRETLSILYRGKSIADVLQMTIEEAKDFFVHHPKVNRALTVLHDIGLGYMALGQAATTLSGGEAQRLKLSRELSKSVRGHCLYILDEPTTGLHFRDIQILLKAINRLVDLGHTVLVIEHNLDVIKSSDYIIDLGPEGGRNGGEIVAQGTPEEVAKVKGSFTGQYLKKML